MRRWMEIIDDIHVSCLRIIIFLKIVCDILRFVNYTDEG